MRGIRRNEATSAAGHWRQVSHLDDVGFAHGCKGSPSWAAAPGLRGLERREGDHQRLAEEVDSAEKDINEVEKLLHDVAPDYDLSIHDSRGRPLQTPAHNESCLQANPTSRVTPAS